MGILRTALRSLGLYEQFRERFMHQYFLPFHLPLAERRVFVGTEDPVRYGAVHLALQRVSADGIEGSMAEVGVYRGATSKVLHALAPERTLYLFDTFEGFSSVDLEHPGDERFKDTSMEAVRQALGDTRNVLFRPGYFPETAQGLEQESFAFVMLDVDLYKPTLAGMEFFYPRLAAGGYLFIHDYNSPESDTGVRRAVDQFMQGRPEGLVELPDVAGSVIIRRSLRRP